MTRRLTWMGVLLAATCGFSACSRLSGKPAPGPEVPRPESVLDPIVLYSQNCAGCHGAEGRKGPAMTLGDPVYLAIVDDDVLRTTISKGRSGTAMSAFAQKEGGMLTAQQIDAIVQGIRERWGQPNILNGVTAPPYAAKASGNPQSGQAAYNTFCASCHGTDNRGGSKAGSVTTG